MGYASGSPAALLAALVLTLVALPGVGARAGTNVFFNPAQVATPVSSNMTSTTVSSEGYVFTYSVDGYWSAYAGGPPTGRFQSIFWPAGFHAQAVTAGPSPGPARVTIKRADGSRFKLDSFTAKLLANTAGAGGSFEVVPQNGGEDALPNPLTFDASGYSGNVFTNHPVLAAGYEAYIIKLYVDYGLIGLALSDTNAPPAVTNLITVTVSPPGAGTVTGAGLHPAGSTANLTATANPGFRFTGWMDNAVLLSPLSPYSFDVTGDLALVAAFATNSPPVAVGTTFHQLDGQPLAINLTDLTALDYDPDGDPVQLAGVAATTANGLGLSTDATQLFVPAGSQPDSFTYTISDGQGGTATGSAFLNIIQSVTGRGFVVAPNPGGPATVGFETVPWYSFTIERATDAGFNSGLRSFSAQAWADGSISLSDDFSDLPSAPPAAFYRLRWP